MKDTITIIDAKSTYRVGTPAMMVQPFNTIGQQTMKNWKLPGFRETVVRTLVIAGIKIVDYNHAKRVRKGRNIDNVPLTLLIESDVSVPGQYETLKVATNDLLQMGSSMGLHESANTGTVSAVVRARSTQGVETTCALTNHHVVAKKGDFTHEACPVDESLSPNHEISQRYMVQVVAPSHPDHQRFLKYMAMEKAGIDKYSARYEHPFGPNYANVVKMVAKTDSDWNTLNTDPDRVLGIVFATSGHSVCNNSDYTALGLKSVSSMPHVPIPAFTNHDGELVPSLAEKINCRTLLFRLNWALIKMAAARTLITNTPHPASSVKVRSPNNKRESFPIRVTR
ncbi:hypothetical protein EJ02DRAFT_469648 [Clathrospora elynae]|uniref:Uncharacterized protein n=1 Tax=Clathrospora elynae TaxID=706981 RepID=A0A6A5SA25_9PLEO|nr:hypothetical protein EJ02DRAFT_469648 [Clathrospora elynae]